MAYRGLPPGGKGPPAKPAGAKAFAAKPAGARQATAKAMMKASLPFPEEEPPRPPSRPPPQRAPQQPVDAPGVKSAAPARALTKAQTLPPAAKRARVEDQAPGPSLVVFSTDETDELGIQPLICGEYVAEGINHGRKYFMKTTQGPSGEDVRLYYWDERDGPDFSGWWFGDEVGGTQVWLHSVSSSAAPPKNGWTWKENEVREELYVMTPDEKAQFDYEHGGVSNEYYEEGAVEEHGQEYATDDGQWAQEAHEQYGNQEVEEEQEYGQEAEEASQENLYEAEQEPSIPPEWEEAIQRASATVSEVEADTEQALEMTMLATDSDLGLTDDSNLRAQELLAGQAQPLLEAQRAAMREGLTQADAPPAVRTAAVELTQRVRTMFNNVKAAERRLAGARQERAQREEEDRKRARDEAKVRALEAQHSSQLEEMLRLSLEKVNNVEDEIEKVEIAATPLEVDNGDGLQSVMLQAVKDTEQHVRVASVAVVEGRRFVAAKVSQGKRLVQNLKSTMLDEIIALQEKLEAAQAKLTSFGSIRQTYEQRVSAKKVLDELQDKLSHAEVEVERAAMSASPAGGESPEASKEAEAIMIKAGVAVSQASRLVESKLKSSGKTNSHLVAGLQEMQTRTKEMQTKLQESQQALKEMKERALADQLMRDVSDKTMAIEVEVEKMIEAGTFFGGDEEDESAIQQVDAEVAEVDRISSSVQSAVTSSEALIKKMQTEMTKVSGESATSLKEAVQQLESRHQEAQQKLQQFKLKSLGLKRKQLLTRADDAVTMAEEELQKLKALASSLVDSWKSGEDGQDIEGAIDLKEGMQQVIELERSVQTGVIAARKAIVDTSSELRKLPGASTGPAPEIALLQTRVGAAQEEQQRLRKQVKNAEERAKARGALQEVIEKVRSVEVEVGETTDSVALLEGDNDDEVETSEAAMKAGNLSAAARNKLNVTRQLVTLKLRTAQGATAEELRELEARLKNAEERLANAMVVVDAQREGAKASDLLAQASERVERAEAGVRMATEAELPFLTGVEELSIDDAGSASAACESAVNGAQEAIADARAFCAKTQVEAKRLSTRAWDKCGPDFATLQERLNGCTSKVAELQRDMLERRRGVQRQLAQGRLAEAEAKVKELGDTLERFPTDKLSGVSADEAHSVCEELARVEQEANSTLAVAKDLLTEQSKQVKGAADSRAMTTEVSKWLAKLRQLQVDFAKLSKEWQTREQNFVAQQMLKEVPQLIQKLEAQVEAAHQVATPMLSGDKSKLLADVHTQCVLAALRERIGSFNADSLFSRITDGQVATKEDLAKFIDELPQPGSEEGRTAWGIPGLPGEQAALALLSVASEDKGLTPQGLKGLLQERLVCVRRVIATESGDSNSTEIGSVEAGETVELLARSKDADGAVRIQCVMTRTGEQAWVTVRGAGRTSADFGPLTTPSGRVQSILAHVEGVCARCGELAQDAEQKAVMCADQHGKPQQQGPLADVRSKLLQLKMKANVHHMKMDNLRKRVMGAKTALLQKWDEAQNKAREAQVREAIERQVKGATDAVEAAEEKATAVLDGVKAGKVFKMKEDELVASLADMQQAAGDAMQNLAEAKAITSKILGSAEASRGPATGLINDKRVTLMKLMSRITSMERKCKTATEVVKTAQSQAQRKLEVQIRSGLRTAVQRSEQSYDEIFDRFAEELADGSKGLTKARVGDLLVSLTDVEAEQHKWQAVLLAFAPEGTSVLHRQDLAEALQDFRVCMKSVAITGSPKLEGAKTIRKMEPGEYLEVLEVRPEEAEAATNSAGASDAGQSLLRVRGRALRDGVVGWVTTSGNKGTAYLQSVKKPYMRCMQEVVMRTSFEDPSSQEVATLQPGQMAELIEGPIEKTDRPELILQGKACKDGAEGWFTLRTLEGLENAATSQTLYVCRSAIALTDVFDIHKCGIVRKVAIGEVLETIGDEDGEGMAIEGDATNSGSEVPSVSRRHFRAISDGATGWVTLRGSQGTVYLELSTSHYLLMERVPLRRGRYSAPQGAADVANGQAVVRWLEPGEAFEVSGQPEQGKQQLPVVSVRVRSVDSLESGWASWTKSSSAAPLQACK